MQSDFSHPQVAKNCCTLSNLLVQTLDPFKWKYYWILQELIDKNILFQT